MAKKFRVANLYSEAWQLITKHIWRYSLSYSMLSLAAQVLVGFRSEMTQLFCAALLLLYLPLAVAPVIYGRAAFSALAARRPKWSVISKGLFRPVVSIIGSRFVLGFIGVIPLGFIFCFVSFFFLGIDQRPVSGYQLIPVFLLASPILLYISSLMFLSTNSVIYNDSLGSDAIKEAWLLLKNNFKDLTKLVAATTVPASVILYGLPFLFSFFYTSNRISFEFFQVLYWFCLTFSVLIGLLVNTVWLIVYKRIASPLRSAKRVSTRVSSRKKLRS